VCAGALGVQFLAARPRRSYGRSADAFVGSGLPRRRSGHTERVARNRSTASLHDLFGRARRAQAHSAALISDHEALHRLSRATLAEIRDRRAARALVVSEPGRQPAEGGSSPDGLDPGGVT
jgi:hypothetical protein